MEADDVIGTLALRSVDSGYKVLFQELYILVDKDVIRSHILENLFTIPYVSETAYKFITFLLFSLL